MPLPPNGAIKMSQIKEELGSSSNSLRAYSLQAGFAIPDKMTDFLGYTALGAFSFAMWTGTVSVNLNGNASFTNGNSSTVSISPTSFNLVRVTTTQTINVTVRVPSGFSNSGTNITGTKTADQPAKLFAYSDWVSAGGSVSINKNNGVVSFTNGTLGTVSSVSPASFNLVTSPTDRDVEVAVTIPSGYANSVDGTVTGTFRTTQAALDETISITLNGSTNTWSPSGQGAQASLVVDVVDLFNTSWTVTSDSNWLTISTSTGTGDGTRTVFAGANYAGQTGYTGNTRSGVITVYKTSDFGIRTTINVSQQVGVAPAVAPTVSLTPPNNSQIAYNDFGNQFNYKLYQGIWTGGTAPTQGSFSMNGGGNFAFYRTDDNTTITQQSGFWIATITNPTASPYSVGVYALSQNNSSTTERTATITFSLGNTAGSNSATATISQAVSPPIFTFADAGATGFAVSQNGTITPPTVSAGSISSITYTNSNSDGTIVFYSTVGTNTTRYATVVVNVPSGYSNSGTVEGEVSAIQPLTPSFTFDMWNSFVLSINQNGGVSATKGNAAAIVSLEPANFDKVYTPTNRDVFVTITVPSGWFNSGVPIGGYKQVEQPAAPADPAVTVYRVCSSSAYYFIEGQYNYTRIEISNECAERQEETTRSVAMASQFTEFFSLTPSDCQCYQ
jgi:hypothetical protein